MPLTNWPVQLYTGMHTGTIVPAHSLMYAYYIVVQLYNCTIVQLYCGCLLQLYCTVSARYNCTSPDIYPGTVLKQLRLGGTDPRTENLEICVLDVQLYFHRQIADFVLSSLDL